jgi:formylglycine-generating enzyme required for sulfatase activity
MNQRALRSLRRAAARGALALVLGASAAALQGGADDPPRGLPDPPPGEPPARALADAEARTAAEMKAYAETVPGMARAFEMLPLPAGSFLLGSPASEPDRDDAEGPQVEVQLEPFWMGKYEVTWDEYHVFMHSLDKTLRARGAAEESPQDPWADAVSRPTPPYVPMDFEMGVDGYPAICMTQFAARQYTKWLSMKTGRFYRLPTEAEWEYACRAGTTTAYSFGDDPADLDAYAWYFDNADDHYQKVGLKKSNPWGLFDMHGNVAEWVLDGYAEGFYATLERGARQPLNWPTDLYPRVVRGGSWDDDPEVLRSAARKTSKPGWKVQDPQLPKSIWYHTDARFVGMRVVRPLVPPPPAERARYWDADVDAVRSIELKQRAGGR